MPVVGVEQSGGGNTANKAPLGLCLARGCHRMGISTGAEAVDGLRFSPAARLGFFAGGGGRTERRWKHRKQSPSGALFSSRVSPYRKQYRGRSRGRFKGFPSRKAGGFLLVAGVEQSGGGNTANKAPVGLCLARGCHRMGISTGAEAVDGLRVSPAARLGVFCWWRGSNRAAVETPQTKPQWGFV